MERGAKAKAKLAARSILENDLFAFAKYINPHYLYGDIHEVVFRWFQSEKDICQLLLMPRGHLKSHCMAVWCVWQITRKPTSTIVYLSAGKELATEQVGAIKGMITCNLYRTLWPEMIRKEEGKRSKWAAWGFNVDHPRRVELGIRDLTMSVKTIKGNSAGLHCSHLVLDDVVVPNNAYTEKGRSDVAAAVAQFASILSPGGHTKGVGTVYHPDDIYTSFREAKMKKFSEEGEFLDEVALWKTKVFEVEDAGDLTGNFLWPRAISPYDGEAYGFNTKELAVIQAKYFSKGDNHQFYAQYYNNANDPTSENVAREDFQFYDQARVECRFGVYYVNGRRVNLTAAMDVAWSTGKRSDYTAIGVTGTDSDHNTYVLALVRFKTKDFTVYYDRIVSLYNEWGFKKLHVETNAGGALVASEMKRILRTNGANLVVVGKAATSHEGKKEERHNAILIPRVKNHTVYFKKGGLTPIAIEEIVLERPKHDDIKDVLTTCIENGLAPSTRLADNEDKKPFRFNKRFGGRMR